MKSHPLLLTMFFVCVLIGCSRESSRESAQESPGASKAAVNTEKTAQDRTAVRADQDKTAPRPSEGASSGQFKPFVVYKDKGSPRKFVPSGYMPTGECLAMNDAWTDGCEEGKTCIKVVYDVPCSEKGRKWAGIYWLNPADNWGDKKGGYNLQGASQLVFWARGDQGGEVIQEFKIGGVGYGREFPDSDSASIGPVILTKEWRQYAIDLRGKDLSYISGGFAWVANVDGNPEQCIFYLDDIHFE